MGEKPTPTLPQTAIKGGLTDEPVEIRFYGRRVAYNVTRRLRTVEQRPQIGAAQPARITNLGDDTLIIERVAVKPPSSPAETDIPLRLPVRLKPGQTFQVLRPYEIRLHS